MNDFFHNTNIEKFAKITDEGFRSAFARATNRTNVTSHDAKLLNRNRWREFRSINYDARVAFGSLISSQFEALSLATRTEMSSEPMFLLTICENQCVSSVEDEDTDTESMRARLRTGLRGLSYLGAIEAAYYSDVVIGANVMMKRCLSWHLHAICWNVSGRELKSRIRALNASGKLRPIADGLKAAHSTPIVPGELPPTVGYVFKLALKGYRVFRVDDTKRSDVLLARYRQKDTPMRPGECIYLFQAMKNISLFDLAVAGGDGVKMLDGVKRECLSL